MCCGKAVKKVKNIAKGITNLAKGVNTELSEQRLKICFNCPRLIGGISCSVCGCAVAAKTRVKDESCPLKKWGVAA